MEEQGGHIVHQHFKEPELKSQVKKRTKIPSNQKLWILRLGCWKDGIVNPLRCKFLDDNMIELHDKLQQIHCRKEGSERLFYILQRWLEE